LTRGDDLGHGYFDDRDERALSCLRAKGSVLSEHFKHRFRRLS